MYNIIKKIYLYYISFSCKTMQYAVVVITTERVRKYDIIFVRI